MKGKWYKVQIIEKGNRIKADLKSLKGDVSRWLKKNSDSRNIPLLYFMLDGATLPLYTIFLYVDEDINSRVIGYQLSLYYEKINVLVKILPRKYWGSKKIPSNKELFEILNKNLGFFNRELVKHHKGINMEWFGSIDIIKRL